MDKIGLSVNPNGIEINWPSVARNELPWVTGL